MLRRGMAVKRGLVRVGLLCSCRTCDSVAVGLAQRHRRQLGDAAPSSCFSGKNIGSFSAQPG